MEGVLRYATIRLEASHVPATLATLLVLMEDHVWVSKHNLKMLTDMEGMLEHFQHTQVQLKVSTMLLYLHG